MKPVGSSLEISKTLKFRLGWFSNMFILNLNPAFPFAITEGRFLVRIRKLSAVSKESNQNIRFFEQNSTNRIQNYTTRERLRSARIFHYWLFNLNVYNEWICAPNQLHGLVYRPVSKFTFLNVTSVSLILKKHENSSLSPFIVDDIDESFYGRYYAPSGHY